MSEPTITVYQLIPQISTVKTLYNFFNVPIAASSGSTGSGQIDVSNYKTKTVLGYLNTGTVSGSLTISGSYDGTNYIQVRQITPINSGGSGSGPIVLTDGLKNISVHLLNLTTGSAISGSLFLTVNYQV